MYWKCGMDIYRNGDDLHQSKSDGVLEATDQSPYGQAEGEGHKVSRMTCLSIYIHKVHKKEWNDRKERRNPKRAEIRGFK
jgi:hypothetical protein